MKKTLTPRQVRYLKANDYLREMEDIRSSQNIEKVEFVPPVIGKRGYGSFRIRYKVPVLVEE